MDNDERKVADCDEDANIEDPENISNDVIEKSVDTDDYMAPDSPDYNPPMDLDDDEEEMKPTIDSLVPTSSDVEADDDVTEVNNSQEASPANNEAAETELHAVSQSSQKAAEAEVANDLAVDGSKASECAKESVVEESQVQDLIDDGANVEDETAIEGPNLEVENISKEVSNDGTIELGSSLDAEEETLSPETTTSTRSNSPVMVNTVEELKKVLVRDDKFKFVVNEEVQKTEEFQKFMAEKIQNAKKDD